MQIRFVTTSPYNRRVKNASLNHSSNQNVLCGSVLIVDFKTQTNVLFESLTLVFDDVIMFLPHRPRSTCRKSSLYIRSELLTQWNAGCKTLNNDHDV